MGPCPLAVAPSPSKVMTNDHAPHNLLYKASDGDAAIITSLRIQLVAQIHGFPFSPKSRPLD